MVDVINIDLYELLDVLPSATTQEIKKAYRKKALKCHPDKNPDNPNAAELFLQLSRALEILTDDSAKAAYDKVINAKKAAKLRNRELDSKRKKLKEDLEARERQAQSGFVQDKSAEEKLKAAIERLRKEGSKQLEEEIEYVRLQVEREKLSRSNNSNEGDREIFRLKLNWTVNKNEETTSDVYSHDNLEKIFSKFGEIAALVVSNKKKGTALLEFTSPAAAVKAQELEKGFLSNPLKVSWLRGIPPSNVKQHSQYGPGVGLPDPVPGTRPFPSVPEYQAFPSAPDVLDKNNEEKEDMDFEATVLKRMRQAEEDKRKLASEKETEGS